ncbi:hypothetical protein RF11_12951 [Thelohanellus kitauei]|uniref:Uncharacterized protein n=1 Tax=Thelohanellus kitauei TaxID=669202 RepID=A0A0C2JDH3_THEKT|nr:hypothetical protein RF11_12951 [Thelohanellus kitauei]
MEFAIVGSVHANLDTLENIANRLKYCLINFSAPEVRCSHTWDCMTYIMASKKKEGCNISVKFVEKIDELSCKLTIIQALYSPICLAIINGCTTTFMININKQGSGVDRITVKKVNIKKDCHRRVNFNKILLIVIGITAAATFTIFVTSCVIYHNFIKSRADEQSEVLRQRRIKFLMQGQFINNTSGRYELPPEILPSTSNRESKLESINE